MSDGKGHFIYLGMRDRIVMLESGSPKGPYREMDRVGHRRVYAFEAGVTAIDVIVDVANPLDSVGVVCLDKETEDALKGVNSHQGISLSVLGKDFLDRDREGIEIREGLKRVLANHRRVEKPEISYDGHLGED